MARLLKGIIKQGANVNTQAIRQNNKKLAQTGQAYVNKNVPRTNIDPNLLSTFRGRILDAEDDYSKGILSNAGVYSLQDNKAIVDKANGNVHPLLQDFQSTPVTDPSQYFKGTGIVADPSNKTNSFVGRLNPDDMRSKLLGNSDYAKRVVYWSGNNAFHNRYKNLTDQKKSEFENLRQYYNVKHPHRTSITINGTNAKGQTNAIAPSLYKNYATGKYTPQTKDFFEQGLADIYYGSDPNKDVNGVSGYYSAISAMGRKVPSVHVLKGNTELAPLTLNTGVIDNQYLQGSYDSYSNKQDRYSAGQLGETTYIPNSKFLTLGTLMHEGNHHEGNVTTTKYDDPKAMQDIGFNNPNSYVGRSSAETVRAIQSGKLPVTRMLMDKVERLAPELVPNYANMDSKTQLDTKAQIVAQLAEDPDLSLATLKRWGAFNPDRPNREQGLEYFIPKAYLTDNPALNYEIVNSLIGLNRSFNPEQGPNPRWKQFYNKVYPQLIGKNKSNNHDNMA